ncbi:MAG: MBL fold metallo-hydrolase [Bacteroidales bacterium]
MTKMHPNSLILFLFILQFSLFGQKKESSKLRIPETNIAEIKYIDSIAYLCTDTVYKEYLQGRKIEKNEPAKAILSILDKKVNDVLKNLAKPESKNKNVVLWQIYNMGYVIQTNSGNIGIDIHCRDAKRFAKHIDALLITHSHFDHYRNDLIDEMRRLNKPIISNWIDSDFKTDTVKTFSIGSFNITTHLGDHYFWKKESNNDMLMFEIETNGVKILHTGDNSSIVKLAEINNVDVFILHHDIINSLPEAVAIVKPKLTILSHVMELGHPRTINGYRWTYAHAMEKSKLIPNEKKGILLWGDSLHLR